MKEPMPTSLDESSMSEKKNYLKINREVLKLAIPGIITTISTPLLGLVDTFLTGHMEGLEHLGAVALGSTLFSLLFWTFGFLRMGTTGLVSNLSHDRFRGSAVFYRSQILALMLALGLIVFQGFIESVCFYFLDSSSEVERLARVYFQIRILSAPATLCLYGIQGYFLGCQNAKVPLILSVFTNLVNLGLNFLLVFGFGFLSDGIAMATVLAQYMTLVLAILILLGSELRPAKFKFSDVIVYRELLEFLSLNWDLLIRTLVLLVCLNFFNFESAQKGELLLGVNSLIMQLWSFMAYGVDGFALAAESLVGKKISSRDRKGLSQLVHVCFLWGFVTASFFALFYYVFGMTILGWITDKVELLQGCKEYLIWAVVAPFVNFACFIWDGVFLGATASKSLKNAMLVSAFFVFFPAYFVLSPLLGNHGLWLAMSLFMLSRGVTLTCLYKPRILNKLDRMIKFFQRVRFSEYSKNG